MENDICGVVIGWSGLQGTWVRTVVGFQGPQLEITAFRGVVIGWTDGEDWEVIIKLVRIAAILFIMSWGKLGVEGGGLDCRIELARG
jgi:hypothetical protein